MSFIFKPIPMLVQKKTKKIRKYLKIVVNNRTDGNNHMSQKKHTERCVDTDHWDKYFTIYYPFALITISISFRHISFREYWTNILLWKKQCMFNSWTLILYYFLQLDLLYSYYILLSWVWNSFIWKKVFAICCLCK